MSNIKEGDFGVITKEIERDCGAIQFYAGSIVKISKVRNNKIFVYKNKDYEKNDFSAKVDCKLLRFQEGIENLEKAFYDGIRNISEL